MVGLPTHPYGQLLAALVTAGALLPLACSSSSAACERAAWAQAGAKMRFSDAVAAHNEAHETGIDHDEGALAPRVEMILAEADTRRACG